MTIPVFLTVKNFSRKHTSIPEGGVRHNIFHAKSNGLEKSGALIRNGRRILIDEEKFFEWLRSRGQK